MKNEEIKENKSNLPAIIIIASAFACLNFYHVSTIFEVQNNFSHLSSLEREFLFKSEMGFYYSFYKRIVTAPSFLMGVQSLMRDERTEYPSVINSFQRFNIYPEVFLGAAFRCYTSFANIFSFQTKECWQVDRGEDLPSVMSCEGLGDESYFYINAVWLAAGCTAGLIFLYGYQLSQSIVGGIISCVCLFFNHAESTRVQWTPPLRESFGYPFILAQMLAVTQCLSQKTMPRWKHLFLVFLTTTCALVTWQFSQFVFLTQVIALSFIWVLNSNKTCRSSLGIIFLGKLIGLQNAVLLLFANEMLLTSFYSCVLLAVMCFVLFIPSFSSNPTCVRTRMKHLVLHAVGVVLATILLRVFITAIVGSKDDRHIYNLLKAKFSSYRDFHTMLYLCAAEFDFISIQTLYNLSSTLLLPSVYLVLVILLLDLLVSAYAIGFSDTKTTISDDSCKRKQRPHQSIKNGSAGSNKSMVIQLRENAISPPVFYNILQMTAFFIMALTIMRLKLFMTPHLCIIASLLASQKYMYFLKSRMLHWAFVVALLSAMSVVGFRNITRQRSIVGEYSNPELEELINWIQKETPEGAAFAGPMPITSTILLTTQRSIVNHPHYEDVHMRERTKEIYRAFGRGTVADLYPSLAELKVSYLVIQDHWCFGEPRRPGCSSLDIWDVEEPDRKLENPLCNQLFDGNASPLQRVFSNNAFVVLRVPSRYVEIKLPSRQYRQ